MNKYSAMELSQIYDEVSDGRTSNSVEDLHDLAVAALRKLADFIEKRPAQWPSSSCRRQPDDDRISLAVTRRRINAIDSLFFKERHPPIEFAPGGTDEEWQKFLAEGDPYVAPPPAEPAPSRSTPPPF